MEKDKIKEYKEEMWKQAKIYNELSHHYSNIADIYVKIAQELEDKYEG